MAIEKNVKVHPSAAVPPLEKAYVMIDRVDYSRVTRDLRVVLVCFASKEDRETVRAALMERTAAMATLQATAQISRVPLSEFASEKEREERRAVVAEHAAARQALDAAQEVIQSTKTLDPPGLPLLVGVPPQEVSACLRDGEPDVALCYQWLTKQGAYSGAEV